MQLIKFRLKDGSSLVFLNLNAIFNSGLADLSDISVVPNSIEHPKNITPHKTRNKKMRILHAGGFKKSKGLLVSLEIAKKLKELNLDFEMSLAGFVYKTAVSTNYLKYLKSKAIEYNIHNNIKFFENNDSLDELLNGNDYLIHPSETEGLPRVVMEAMMYKLVVIANPVGGVIELINNHVSGYITDFNSVDDYVYYLLMIHKNQKLADEITTRAKDVINNGYTIEQQLQAFKSSLKWSPTYL